MNKATDNLVAMPLATHVTTQLPPLMQLLVTGGDARIALDTHGVNRYGFAPVPDLELLAFGSSTASGISTAGFAAAENTRNRLMREMENDTTDVVYAREMERIRCELITLCGLQEMSGLDVIMAASGTDIHLIASHLLATTQSHPVVAIMVDDTETGGGVPLALATCHFSSRAALGAMVEKGLSIEVPGAGGVANVEVDSVPLRHADGMPRLGAEVDADFSTWVRARCATGQHVLLVLSDVSKSGLIAPSPVCALALKDQFPQQMDVLVDACQFRMSAQTLRAYLEQGCMVALTGSKFLGGPPFCGALLLPPAIAARLRNRPVPHALSDYSATGDWPRGWDTHALGDTHNFGLLLRWEVALHELSVFKEVAEEDIAAFLRTFADKIQQRLAEDVAFAALPVPALERKGLNDVAVWDTYQTIFPFLLRDAEGKFLTHEEAVQVYHLLQQDLGDYPGVSIEPACIRLRYQLGQPIKGGVRDGIATGALRLCVSARLIVEAVQAGAREKVLEQAMAALDKAAELAHTARVRAKEISLKEI